MSPTLPVYRANLTLSLLPKQITQFWNIEYNEISNTYSMISVSNGINLGLQYPFEYIATRDLMASQLGASIIVPTPCKH